METASKVHYVVCVAILVISLDWTQYFLASRVGFFSLTKLSLDNLFWKAVSVCHIDIYIDN